MLYSTYGAIRSLTRYWEPDMVRRIPRFVHVLVFVGALGSVEACAHRVNTRFYEPSELATLDDPSPFLKAHLASGHVYVLSAWRVDTAAGAIIGTGQLLDPNRAEVATGDFTLPADSVRLFETNVVSQSGASVGLTVMVGITAAVAAVCAANPKACFGSCPTYYVEDETGTSILQAEGFSSSIAPALEATDVDMLIRARPTERDLRVRVTNEALETHVIRHTDVLAVRRPAGGRVFVTTEGTFLGTSEPLAPAVCSAPEGDCLAAVTASDGVERFSWADSSDLGRRETIDLAFEDVPDEDVGLVLQSRQTLMTTFLIYQALAYLGHEAGRWLAAAGSLSADERASMGSIERLLGKVEVLLLDESGEWVIVGAAGETGPLAADTKVVPLAERSPSGAPLRVRLRLTQGLWRLDRVALVGLGGTVEPVRIAPRAVRRAGAEDPEALRVLVDPDEALVTLPGDDYELEYRLPERPEEHELFLEARGYYLEWMR
ncbi:MAG: hypothetical protein FJ207_09395 [Gemmatimonadetes bacterium]|nr:hypothetical protein [Gemmatimonadota bacterium]